MVLGQALSLKPAEHNTIACCKIITIMNTDTVYVLNQTKIPSNMQVFVDNMPDTMSINGTVVVSNMAKPTNYDSQLDSLFAIGKDVAEYGFGYSDAISNIAFPLIIAIFAFALPFMFSAINHVNNKYDSIAIANMFKSSKRYKTFWWSIAVNVGAMLVYGGLSLLPFDKFHHCLGVVFSYLFVGLTGWMVVSVFLFIQYCMLFNKPQSVAEEINNRHSKERNEAKKKDLKFAKKVKKSSKAKSDSGKRVWEMVGSIYGRSYSGSADFNLINRLSEMCRYAIRVNDYNIYSTVWSKVYEIQKDEKAFDDTKVPPVADDCQKNLTNSFLLKTFENIGESAVNIEIQGSLIRTWLQCFAQDKHPNHIDFYLLMRALFKVAGRGNIGLVEKYFADSKYSFRYVLTLPQVLYVKGGDISNMPNEEQKSREEWEKICDYHFMLAAFAYYMGLKSLPKQVLSDEFGLELLPQNRQELLLTYARCKTKMTSDGGYDFSNAEELYGRRVDPEFIDTFAVLLFALLNDSEAYNYFMFTTEEIIEKVKGYKTLFYEIGEKFKKDAYIKTNLNKVCQLNFNKAFEESIRILESKPSKETFESELSEILTNNIKIHLHNQVLQIKNEKLEMWGKDSDDKTELLELGVCPIRMTKHIVEQWPAGDVWYYLQNVPEIIRNRAYYLYMQVLLSWQCDVKKVQPDSIADTVKIIINGHPEDFVFVDYDSHVNTWLNMDYKIFRNPKCEGIDYVMCSSIGYLRDSYFYKQLEGRLFLIRKKDLPALMRTVDEDVDVAFDYQCNYETNNMDLRVLIDSKYVLKYNKEVTITSFEVAPMKIN